MPPPPTMPDPAPGLSLLADGFRRVGPVPGPRDAGRLRALLAAAASGPVGASGALQDGLATLSSWENASGIAPLLPAGAFGRSPAARRILRAALCFLGTQPTPPAALDLVARGAPARVVGKVQRARWKQFSHIWFKGESSGHNVRLLVEEGHDFFLAVSHPLGLRLPFGLPLGQEAPEVLVLAAGGWLAGGLGTALDIGDRVEVLGFVDQVIEHASRSSPRNPRGEPMALALRAGDELPLVVRKIAADATTADAGRRPRR
jgi:hypothetical protein